MVGPLKVEVLSKVRFAVCLYLGRRFAQDFKDELCREVIDTSKPIKDVADAYGVGTETLRNWIIKDREVNGGSEE